MFTYKKNNLMQTAVIYICYFDSIYIVKFVVIIILLKSDNWKIPRNH